MKTKFLMVLLAVLVFAPFLGLGQILSLEAKIEGSSNRKVYLSVRGASKSQILLDSTVSVSDRFAFRHKPEELNLYRLTIDQVPGSIMFIWDGNVKIEGDSKAIWEARIAGSPLTEELKRYDREFTDPAREKVMALSNQLRDPNLSAEKREALGRQQLAVNEALLLQAEKYITEHTKSFISLLFLHNIWKSLGPEKTKRYIGLLANDLQNHTFVKPMLEGIKVMAPVNPGMPAPNFTARDLKGNEVALSDLRGQYVLLDFWGSWCGPCIKLIPETKEAHKKYQGKKVQFLGVALDEEKDRDKLKGLIEKHGMNWPQIFQDKSDKVKSDIVNKYVVYEYPTVILINPKGDIIYRGTGQKGLEEASKVLDKEIN